MKESENNIKERVKILVLRLKDAGVTLYANSRSKSALLYGKAIANKRKILISLLAVLVLAGIGVSSFYILRWWKYRNESPTFTSLRKAELTATGKVGSKVVMGDLEVTLNDVIEGTYHPLEVDENFRRIPAKGYFGAQVLIFNTGYNDKEFLLFGLTDDLGNQYERDKEIDFYLDGTRDFGPAREIYPRTIRGGEIGSEKVYLLFPALDPNAKKLQLIVMSETTNKKAVFEINL